LYCDTKQALHNISIIKTANVCEQGNLDIQLFCATENVIQHKSLQTKPNTVHGPKFVAGTGAVSQYTSTSWFPLLALVQYLNIPAPHGSHHTTFKALSLSTLSTTTTNYSKLP